MIEPIIWKSLEPAQRNLLIHENVMGGTIPSFSRFQGTKQTPPYSTDLKEALLVMLHVTEQRQTTGELTYEVQSDLALINIRLDETYTSVRGGGGEQCAEAICIAA